jgi:hypothetical protein
VGDSVESARAQEILSKTTSHEPIISSLNEDKPNTNAPDITHSTRRLQFLQQTNLCLTSLTRLFQTELSISPSSFNHNPKKNGMLIVKRSSKKRKKKKKTLTYNLQGLQPTDAIDSMNVDGEREQSNSCGKNLKRKRQSLVHKNETVSQCLLLRKIKTVAHH